MPNITPTVGRKVWYFLDSLQTEPWDATVIKVHAAPGEATPDTPVNLLVINPDSGGSIFRPRIQHHADGEAHQGERFAWMPYQAAQASKATNEVKVYTDGSMATGPGPLPNTSPGGAPVAGLAPDSTDETAADNVAGQVRGETQTADTEAT